VDRPAGAVFYTVTDLGDLGGLGSNPHGINARGEIVGESRTRGPESHIHGFLYSGGRMIDIGPPGSGDGRAWAINEGGEVVGFVQPTTGPGRCDHGYNQFASCSV